MSERITLSELLDQRLASKGRSVPRAMPAKIVKWDADKQRANCKILVQQPYEDEEGERKVESVAVVPGVPVMWPQAGGFRLTCPISDGTQSAATTGLLIWCNRSIDRWLSGDGKEVDPELDHEDSIADAVFIPGLNPFAAPIGDFPTDHATFGADDGVQAHFRSDVICIGDESGAQFIALADKVKTELDNIQSTLDTLVGIYNAHTHTWSGFGSGTTATPVAQQTNDYAAQAVAASQAKAK